MNNKYIHAFTCIILYLQPQGATATSGAKVLHVPLDNRVNANNGLQKFCEHLWTFCNPPLDLLQAPRSRPGTLSPEHMSSLDRAYEALHRQFLHELERNPLLAHKVEDSSLENNDSVSIVLKLMRAINHSDDIESTIPQLTLLVLWRVFAAGGVFRKRLDEPFFDPVLFEAASFLNTDEGMSMFMRIYNERRFWIL